MRFDKANVNHQTYKGILGQVQRKIKAYATMRKTSLTIKIPEHVPGRPIYRVNRAARYVTEKLVILGFDATSYGAGTGYFIDVGWKSAAPTPRRPKPPVEPKPSKKKMPSIVVSAADVSDRLDTLRRRLEGIM